jgi:hypothetical protein
LDMTAMVSRELQLSSSFLGGSQTRGLRSQSAKSQADSEMAKVKCAHQG